MYTGGPAHLLPLPGRLCGPCSPGPADRPPLSLPHSSSEGQHHCSPTCQGAGIGAVLVHSWGLL